MPKFGVSARFKLIANVHAGNFSNIDFHADDFARINDHANIFIIADINGNAIAKAKYDNISRL